jgi:hypothetical protein
MVGEPKRVVAPQGSQRYGELVRKLRGIARQSGLPGTRQKILDLALRLEAAPIDSTGKARRTISPRTRAK